MLHIRCLAKYCTKCFGGLVLEKLVELAGSCIPLDARNLEKARYAREGKMNEGDTTKKKADQRQSSSGSEKKTGQDLVLENVRITHPGKVLYGESGITKGDVAEYYLKVSGRMLPYLVNRIVSAVRCPGGVEGPCFFKKHPTGDSRGVASFSVPAGMGTPSGAGKTEEYYYLEDIHGLLAEVQMNTLEFHTWGSRVETLETPDIMVFDLDPDVGMGIERIRQGVKDLKNILDQRSLTSYLKTSGGKGYHIVIPFKPTAGWGSFHEFARNIAKTMEAIWPGRYTSNERKAQRIDRIFIDWLRNGRGATSVAPYSVRARKGAPVSMPIFWKELDTVTPNEITMTEAVARLRRKDPWEGFFEARQQLK